MWKNDSYPHFTVRVSRTKYMIYKLNTMFHGEEIVSYLLFRCWTKFVYFVGEHDSVRECDADLTRTLSFHVM